MNDNDSNERIATTPATTTTVVIAVAVPVTQVPVSSHRHHHRHHYHRDTECYQSSTDQQLLLSAQSPVRLVVVVIVVAPAVHHRRCGFHQTSPQETCGRNCRPPSGQTDKHIHGHTDKCTYRQTGSLAHKTAALVTRNPIFSAHVWQNNRFGVIEQDSDSSRNT